MESGEAGNNSNGGGQLCNGDEDEGGQIIGLKRKRIIYNKEFLIECSRHPVSKRKPVDFPLPDLGCTLAAIKPSQNHSASKSSTPAAYLPPRVKSEVVVGRREPPTDNISLRPHSGSFIGGCSPVQSATYIRDKEMATNELQKIIDGPFRDKEREQGRVLNQRFVNNKRFDFNNPNRQQQQQPESRENNTRGGYRDRDMDHENRDRGGYGDKDHRGIRGPPPPRDSGESNGQDSRFFDRTGGGGGGNFRGERNFRGGNDDRDAGDADGDGRRIMRGGRNDRGSGGFRDRTRWNDNDGKWNDHESGQNKWGHNNYMRNGRGDGEHGYMKKDYHQDQDRDYHHRRGRDREEEKEPEWFSDGPASRHETMELRGFMDDDRNDRDENKKSNNKNASGHKKVEDSNREGMVRRNNQNEQMDKPFKKRQDSGGEDSHKVHSSKFENSKKDSESPATVKMHDGGKHTLSKNKVESLPEKNSSFDEELDMIASKQVVSGRTTEEEEPQHKERIELIDMIIDSSSKTRSQRELEIQFERLLKMETPPLPVEKAKGCSRFTQIFQRNCEAAAAEQPKEEEGKALFDKLQNAQTSTAAVTNNSEATIETEEKKEIAQELGNALRNILQISQDTEKTAPTKESVMELPTIICPSIAKAPDTIPTFTPRPIHIQQQHQEYIRQQEAMKKGESVNALQALLQQIIVPGTNDGALPDQQMIHMQQQQQQQQQQQGPNMPMPIDFRPMDMHPMQQGFDPNGMPMQFHPPVGPIGPPQNMTRPFNHISMGNGGFRPMYHQGMPPMHVPQPQNHQAPPGFNFLDNLYRPSQSYCLHKQEISTPQQVMQTLPKETQILIGHVEIEKDLFGHPDHMNIIGVMTHGQYTLRLLLQDLVNPEVKRKRMLAALVQMILCGDLNIPSYTLLGPPMKFHEDPGPYQFTHPIPRGPRYARPGRQNEKEHENVSNAPPVSSSMAFTPTSVMRKMTEESPKPQNRQSYTPVESGPVEFSTILQQLTNPAQGQQIPQLPMNQQGPPMNQQGPPMNQQGPPMNQQGPPMNQQGPPIPVQMIHAGQFQPLHPIPMGMMMHPQQQQPMMMHPNPNFQMAPPPQSQQPMNFPPHPHHDIPHS